MRVILEIILLILIMKKIYYQRFSILRKAFARFEADEDFYDFVKENEFWLEDYSFIWQLKTALTVLAGVSGKSV